MGYISSACQWHPLKMQWLPVWATAPLPLNARDLQLQTDGRSFANTTIRQTVRINLACQQIRLTISNLFGSAPLNIEGTTVALAVGNDNGAGSAAISLPTMRRVTRHGSSQFQIPSSGSCVSDPIQINIARGQHLSVSMYLADGQAGEHISGHFIGHTDTWLRRGDVRTRYNISDGVNVIHWFWITSVEALVPDDCGTISCFGDSITDTILPTNTYAGWADGLAKGLDALDSPFSVLNLGISGDRLCTGGIARFPRDILKASHGQNAYLIVHIGVNDLGFTPPDEASQHDLFHRLTTTYQQVCQLAHQHDLVVIGTTIMPLLSPPNWLTPWEFSDARRDATRQKVNGWILSCGHFNKVIDFSAAVTDPEHPNRMRSTYHNGDYLHPSPEGYRAMTKAIDLGIFKSSPRTG